MDKLNAIPNIEMLFVMKYQIVYTSSWIYENFNQIYKWITERHVNLQR